MARLRQNHNCAPECRECSHKYETNQNCKYCGGTGVELDNAKNAPTLAWLFARNVAAGNIVRLETINDVLRRNGYELMTQQEYNYRRQHDPIENVVKLVKARGIR